MTTCVTPRTGAVEGLFVASCAGEPMQPRREVEVQISVGIPGDRYATGLGHWSDPQWPDQQVTLVEAELAQELGLEPHQLRRNIVTSGVDLSGLVGREFQIGTARLRGVRPCDPCRYLETLTRPGLYDALGTRGGLRAEVRESGRIAVGDAVELLSASGSRSGDGGEPRPMD